jgi:hypothetical protein
MNPARGREGFAPGAGPFETAMLNRSRRLTPLLVLVFVLGAAAEGRAQADPQNFLFSSGQSIQPFFDGWSHHPDGGFDMYFGYLNRNYVEELHIPVGGANRMAPGEPDQGQPTYFYPRTNRRVFSVTVPADWGDRRLEWQVTVNEQTYRALGWLQPEWEIFANAAAARAGGQGDNQPPALAVTAPAGAAPGEPVTLSAAVTDDGLPPPRRRGGGGRGTLSTFEQQPGEPTLPVNVPQLQASARKRPVRTPVEIGSLLRPGPGTQVNVTWTQLRGAAGVTLEPQNDLPDGEAAVTAIFPAPGEYLFRVQASDNRATVTEEVAVTVR